MKPPEEILIAQVLQMKAKGFSASKAETLPSLFKQRYGRLYNSSCGSCVKEAFDMLVNWAQSKNPNALKEKHMKYRFKKEYQNNTVSTFYQGERRIITANNLTDQLAHIILSIPKYAHIIEQITTAEKDEIPTELDDNSNKNIGSSSPASTVIDHPVTGTKSSGRKKRLGKP